ncbi:MAG: hypothetical protein NT075_36965 [Chloroflexi bacterium]|nr:hypothetical protein [Chloroflexota bacterium]
MVSELDHAGINGQVDLTMMEAAWQRIRQHLEAEKLQIYQEIRQYPPPIPACDVQFNSLLTERVTILQELGQVEGILKQSLPASDPIRLLDEFVRASHYMTSELEESIRQLLTKSPDAAQIMIDRSS